MEIILGFVAGVAASYIFWPVMLALLCFTFMALDFEPEKSKPAYGWALIWTVLIAGVVVLRGGVEALYAITLWDVLTWVGVYFGLGLLTVIGKFALASFKFRDALFKQKLRFLNLLKEVDRDTFVKMFLTNPLARADERSDRAESEEVQKLRELYDNHRALNEDSKLPPALTNLFSHYLKNANSWRDSWREYNKHQSTFQWHSLRAVNRVIQDGDKLTTVVALNPRELPLYTWGFWWPVYIVEFVYRPVIQLFKMAINQLVRGFNAVSLKYSSANI